MPSICPKDFKSCPDDLCRGSGTCMRTGSELLELCAVCHHVYSPEYDIDCACEPDDEYREDDPFEDEKAGTQ